jgi:hypothetical protein
MSKKPPEDDRDGILTKLMSLGRGRSALPPTTEPAAEPTYVPPSRQTKKTFTAWMDRDALAQLKRLSEHKRQNFPAEADR